MSGALHLMIWTMDDIHWGSEKALQPSVMCDAIDRCYEYAEWAELQIWGAGDSRGKRYSNEEIHIILDL